ncbi:hypothetical protein [Adhaeribacter radiodurans]|uniref:Uncharacterized protein n=1 Tax=Adhaeribacter radiodurans TaxID=2745197 RepID=A0A7L7L505_9BACT|nr:hypothetical protein [Adhaeribacter radiodurans]QMU27675.1 hypothetical protein HUW48_06265 [Adhaeribacter radiodurans]
MDDKEERKERIKLLRRQEDRKHRLPSLINYLSIIADREILENEVLTLEEIDNYNISVNCSDFDFNYLNISFPQERAQDLLDKLQVLANELEGRNFLTLPQWADIAVMKVKADLVLLKFQELIDLDKNSIYVYDLNYQNGLWIDLYSEYWYLDGSAKLRQILELRIFGKEWMKKVAASL